MDGEMEGQTDGRTEGWTEEQMIQHLPGWITYMGTCTGIHLDPQLSKNQSENS